jgi:hypothetical protein
VGIDSGIITGVKPGLVRGLAGLAGGGGGGGGGPAGDLFNGSDGAPFNPAIWSEYQPSVHTTREQRGGRSRIVVDDNTGDKTLWYLTDDGHAVFEAAPVAFPFERIAHNIGIGKTGDSQTAPIPGTDTIASPWMFSGVLVHGLTLGSLEYRGCFVGHRGGTNYTYEQKNSPGTGTNNIVDGGANVAPLGRLDLRIVGTASNEVEFYFRQPGGTTWTRCTEAQFQLPTFAATCRVGFLAYTFAGSSMPFVGTMDRWEVV